MIREEGFTIAGHSLIAARWIALLGQTLAVLIAYYSLQFEIPLIPCLLFIIASGIVNNYASIKDHHRPMEPNKSLAYLTFDSLQLTGLLYLTGGLTNPFFVLLIAPILMGSSLLPRWHMFALLCVGMASTVYLSIYYEPLKWPTSAVGLRMDSLRFHIAIEAIALGITLIFASYYAWQVAEENRSMQKANFAARTALLKQQQLQALGAQAAAAVHELGSPLGTIAIITKDLATDIKTKYPDLQEDMTTLAAQAERCRQILAHFGKTLSSDPTYMREPLTFRQILRDIAEQFLQERPEVRFRLESAEKADLIQVIQTPELTHGLGVYIQNAIQFAQTELKISVERERGLIISIEDDGPGFDSHILPRLGQPYTSTRIESGKNMGLGVFIAQTLLEDTGAEISYNNKNSGGAQVILRWSERKIKFMIRS